MKIDTDSEIAAAILIALIVVALMLTRLCLPPSQHTQVDSPPTHPEIPTPPAP